MPNEKWWFCLLGWGAGGWRGRGLWLPVAEGYRGMGGQLTQNLWILRSALLALVVLISFLKCMT